MVCLGGVRMLGYFAFDVLHAEFCGWRLLISLVRGAGQKNVFCVHVFCFCVCVWLRRLTVLLGVWAFNLAWFEFVYRNWGMLTFLLWSTWSYGYTDWSLIYY